MSQQLTVIGAGGHAKVVISTARAAGWHVGMAFDDDPAKIGGEVLGVPVVGPVSEVLNADVGVAVLACGGNRVRARLAGEFDFDWVSIVHPAATVHDSVEIAAGAVIFAGAVVQPDAIVGKHAIVNTGATIDHDGVIGPFAHIAPGANLAGEVDIREGAFVGIGAAVIVGCSIGAWAVLGAGAVATTDVAAGVTAVGVPARAVSS